MGKFSLLFSLRFEHLGFEERCCKSFEIMPLDECRHLMENAGIVAKNDLKGIHLFYEEEKADVLRLYIESADSPLRFAFKAYSNDPQFFNYTDLPIKMDGAVFYFDNLISADKTSGVKLLNKDDYVSEKDLKQIASLSDRTVLTKKEKRLKPLFVVDIFTGEYGTLFSDDENNKSPKDYVIRFQSRHTYWKYLLLNELATDKFYVDDPNRKVLFEKSKDAETVANKPASVYRSNMAIPLQEESKFVFQLKERNSGSGKILIKRLPVASANQVCREFIYGKEAFVSEIFINR